MNNQITTYTFEKAFFEANNKMFVSATKAAVILDCGKEKIVEAKKQKILQTDRNGKIYVPSLMNLARQLTSNIFPKNINKPERRAYVLIFGNKEDEVKYLCKN